MRDSPEPVAGVDTSPNASTHDRWVQRDAAVVWHGFTQMSTFATNTPVIVDRAEGRELVDVDGRRFFDGISSLWVTTLGHRVPELDQAVRDQLDKVAHTTMLGHGNRAAIEFAEDLVTRVPVDDAHVLFGSDGAIAVEQAAKIAFQYHRNRGDESRTTFLTLGDAYHGDSVGSMSLGADGFGTELFGPLRFPTLRTPGYAVDGWADTACRALDIHSAELAALVIEPVVQGAAGIVTADPADVGRVMRHARALGVLVVCDEVATGFGRTGALFATELCDARPDLMALGKGITGGYLPLAATVAAGHVFDAFLGDDLGPRTLYHGHSYGGNALACAVARRHLQLMDEWNVLANVRERGGQLARLLSPLRERRHVARVDHLGLMAGVELSPPADGLRWGRRVSAACVEAGVLVRPLGDVIVFMPPLTSTSTEIERLATTVIGAIEAVTSEGAGEP